MREQVVQGLYRLLEAVGQGLKHQKLNSVYYCQTLHDQPASNCSMYKHQSGCAVIESIDCVPAKVDA